MKAKALIAAVLVLAVVLVGIAIFLDRSGGADPTAGETPAVINSESQPAEPDASEQAKPSGSDSKKPVATGAPAQSADASKGSKNSASEDKSEPTAQATRPSWNPQPTETDSGLEVPTQSATEKFSLPVTEERAPVLKKAPASGNEEGKLTKGFPAKALPLPKSTTIVKSSVAEQGNLVMVGVEGRSKDSVEEVLDFYSSHFSELQWLAEESNPAEGTTQIRGGYGEDSATVTVRELPTGMTSISAAGVFKVAG